MSYKSSSRPSSQDIVDAGSRRLPQIKAELPATDHFRPDELIPRGQARREGTCAASFMPAS
jgi:hypothetical protein